MASCGVGIGVKVREGASASGSLSRLSLILSARVLRLLMLALAPLSVLGTLVLSLSSFLFAYLYFLKGSWSAVSAFGSCWSWRLLFVVHCFPLNQAEAGR
jgi:hypothetical protein